MRMMALWWWIDRWRKSTAFTDLTLEEQGAYRNLLDEATLRGGSIPNDERILAKACGDALAWKRIRANVIARFFLSETGWQNETLNDVLKESQKRSQRQRDYRDRRRNGRDNAEPDQPDNKEPHADHNAVDNKPVHPISGSHLPSPDPISVREGARPLGVMAGTLPRDHIRHAWCSERGKCVPEFLHTQFMASLGGDRDEADRRLRAFYGEVEASWPAGPIGDAPVRLWEREFAARFPSVAPVQAARRQEPSTVQGCKHTPKCTDAADCTRLRMQEMKRGA